MRHITVTTELDAPAGVVWTALSTDGQAFEYVTRGLVRYPAIRAWRDGLAVGDRLEGRLWLGGVVPAWRHTLTVVQVDTAGRRLVTEEHGGVLRRWRHTIDVVPLGAARCRYRDHVEIDAGRLTTVVAGVAAVFYRIRQRRWRTAARLLSIGWSAAADGPDA